MTTVHTCECGATQISEEQNPPRQCETCHYCKTVPWAWDGRPGAMDHDWDAENMCRRCLSTMEQIVEEQRRIRAEIATKVERVIQ